MRRELISILIGIALSSCKSGDDGAAPRGDATAGDMTPGNGDGGDPCSGYALRFTPTCDGCPTAPLACPCLLQGLGYDPIAGLARCGENGRCLLNVDCSKLCELAPDAADQLASAGDFFTALNVLQICVTDQQTKCNRDGDCRQGRCVGEQTAEGGHCAQTAAGAPCYEPSDCLVGRCLFPDTATSAGGDDAGADVDSDATADANADVSAEAGSSAPDAGAGTMPEAGSEATPETGPSATPETGPSRTPEAGGDGGLRAGLCTAGEVTQPCVANQDCQHPFHCFVRDPPFGVCVAGVVGDPCHTTSDCQLPVCSADGLCVAGRLGNECKANQDCASKSCVHNPFGTGFPANVCQSGAIGSFCFDNTQCESGICALTMVNGRAAPGICHNGDGGDPCTTAQDCKSQQCMGGDSTDTSCQSGALPLEQPCGNGGVCSVISSLCLYGKCSAPETD